MPLEQPLEIEWLLISARGIEHQFCQAFRAWGGAAFFVQSQAPRER